MDRSDDKAYGDSSSTRCNETPSYFWEKQPRKRIDSDHTSVDGIPASIAVLDSHLQLPVAASARSCPAQRPSSVRWRAAILLGTLRKGRERVTGHRASSIISSHVATVRADWRSSCRRSIHILITGALTAAAISIGIDAERECGSSPIVVPARGLAMGKKREATVSHGGKPETGSSAIAGRIGTRALILYVLGLGSPTHPLQPRAIPRGRRPIAERSFTATNFFTAPRCSSSARSRSD